MHTFPHRGPIPGVEAGIVLAFPCPGCERWARPATASCGCYECQLCGKHVPPINLQIVYAITRAHMPQRLTYN